MGIEDREYYRDSYQGGPPLSARSMLTWIVGVNLVVWMVQVIVDGNNDDQPVTTFLACQATALFDGFPQVWKLITANFAHSLDRIWHLAGNMLILVILGRDVEARLGKREFLALYLTGGALAILVECAIQYATGTPYASVLGASGSVMTVVVLCGTLFPHRVILLFAVFPIKLWVLCAVFVFFDLLGAFDRGSNVAHFAHLAGAAYGFLYGRFDWRWSTLLGRFRRRRGVSRPRAVRPRVVERTPRKAAVPQVPRENVAERNSEANRVSERIDELLAKIHDQGMASLTPEEVEFLQNNSGRYRSS